MFEEGAKCLGRLHNVQSCWFRLLSTFRLLFHRCAALVFRMFEEGATVSVISSKCLSAAKSTVWAPHWAPKSVTDITIVLVFNKVTLQSTHWSIQTLFISGGDSSCSWVFYSCTGPKSGKGVVLVDCNAVGGWPRATSINQCVE